MKKKTNTISPERESKRIMLWNRADFLSETPAWGIVIGLLIENGAQNAWVNPRQEVVWDAENILQRLDSFDVNDVLTRLRREGDNRPRAVIIKEYRQAYGLIGALAREYR